MAVGIRHADHVSLSIRKKLALISLPSGGRSVGIVHLRTTEHPSLAERSRLRSSDDQRYSVAQRSSLRPALTSFLCSWPTCGLLVTTRLGPITAAFCTGPGVAKVYRLLCVRTELSVSELRCVRIHSISSLNLAPSSIGSLLTATEQCLHTVSLPFSQSAYITYKCTPDALGWPPVV
jgi:hypothetical protein